jgi:hypothetical protein
VRAFVLAGPLLLFPHGALVRRDLSGRSVCGHEREHVVGRHGTKARVRVMQTSRDAPVAVRTCNVVTKRALF